ncbi:TPA: Panacea domain-containing protein [Streptococcus equi subsp. zooepidemicus]
MKQYSVYSIADWFLSKDSLTPKKIQKLSYYFEAWANALYGKSLINDTQFEAWVHGPVSPELYNKYREYKWQEVPQKEVDQNIYEKDALELLESVWLTYGDKSANELEALTHSEEPWKKARVGLSETEVSNNIIDVEDMKKYYASIYIGD